MRTNKNQLDIKKKKNQIKIHHGNRTILFRRCENKRFDFQDYEEGENNNSFE